MSDARPSLLMPTDPAEASPARIHGVDALRGLVMVTMALDHAREFFAPTLPKPEDLDHAWPFLFMTRWITHFCAPVFVCLAGVSASLSAGRGGSKARRSWRLVWRGLWLILLEVTIIRTSWFFDLNYQWVFVQVIWVIGVSMIVLAGALWLPRAAIAAIGLAMIGGHNLLDGITVNPGGASALPWMLLHQPGYCWLAGKIPDIIIIYPLIPWIGVLLCGYAFAPILRREAPHRRRVAFSVGAGLTAAFVALRWSNIYGDAHAWTTQSSVAMSLCSFLNCEKYPPSLMFLMMTLGPALMILAWLDRPPGRIARAVSVFGRVPMFYYLLHLPLLHAMAVAFSYWQVGGTGWWFGSVRRFPAGYPSGLGYAYGAWVVVVAFLYPICHLYARYKKRHRNLLTQLL